jgi:hypothetical protein
MISILSHLLSSDGHMGPVYESRTGSILQPRYEAEWKKLHKKPYDVFTEEFQSNWGKQTGMLWQEWGK